MDGRGLRQSRTTGGATDDFVWSTIGGLPLLLDDGDHAYLYGPSLTPVAQVDDAGAVEYLHGDLLGSVRAITDSSGAVVGSSTFDSFGSRTAHTGGADSAFGFTGNWTDPDTGLVHLRARDYDPATGQFLSVDPAVDTTKQPYAYTGNNPVQRTDPSGLDFMDDGWPSLSKETRIYDLHCLVGPLQIPARPQASGLGVLLINWIKVVARTRSGPAWRNVTPPAPHPPRA